MLSRHCLLGCCTQMWNGASDIGLGLIDLISSGGSDNFPCKFTDNICKGTWDFLQKILCTVQVPCCYWKWTLMMPIRRWRTGFLRYNLKIHNNDTEFMKTSENVSWVLQEVEHRTLTESSLSWYSGIHGNFENSQTIPSLFSFQKSHYINNSS